MNQGMPLPGPRKSYVTTSLSAAAQPRTTTIGQTTIQMADSRPRTLVKLGPALFKAAWLAVLLGISLQIILSFLSVLGGKEPKSASLIAETASRLSWSLLTCVGLAMGMAIARMRLYMVGFAGFLAASLSFTVARAVQVGLNEALSIASTGGTFPYTVALIKGAEYAILGITLGWIARRRAAYGLTVIAAGLVIGVVFSNLLMAVAVVTAKQPLPPIEIIIRYINEAIFPVGCSAVIIAARITDLFIES